MEGRKTPVTDGTPAMNVPVAYLTWANSVFSAFFPFSRINKLRRINRAPNCDSPRRHQNQD